MMQVIMDLQEAEDYTALGRSRLGHAIARQMIAEGQGFAVIPISRFEWEQLPSTELKAAFLYQKLYPDAMPARQPSSMNYQRQYGDLMESRQNTPNQWAFSQPGAQIAYAENLGQSFLNEYQRFEQPKYISEPSMPAFPQPYYAGPSAGALQGSTDFLSDLGSHEVSSFSSSRPNPNMSEMSLMQMSNALSQRPLVPGTFFNPQGVVTKHQAGSASKSTDAKSQSSR